MSIEPDGPGPDRPSSPRVARAIEDLLRFLEGRGWLGRIGQRCSMCARFVWRHKAASMDDVCRYCLDSRRRNRVFVGWTDNARGEATALANAIRSILPVSTYVEPAYFDDRNDFIDRAYAVESVLRRLRAKSNGSEEPNELPDVAAQFARDVSVHTSAACVLNRRVDWWKNEVFAAIGQSVACVWVMRDDTAGRGMLRELHWALQCGKRSGIFVLSKDAPKNNAITSSATSVGA